jgi:K+-transporting ATPase A subunit
MLPDIGLIIAAYVVTRMADLLGRRTERANIAARVLAILTIVITVFCAVDMVIRGSSIPTLR